jgi:NitT/TauT family transport system substrate-binding protein
MSKAFYVLATLATTAIAMTSTGFEATAQTQKLKVAYARAPQLISHWHAEKLGLFKKEGIDPEILTLNNGPAVAAAVTSGSVDFGWSAAGPIITAREQNQPFKAFMASRLEAAPDDWVAYLIASAKSGVKTIADLKGKTIITNAVGAACELAYRTHFRKAGLKFEDVKTIIVPFPQVAASLELGNGDAACLLEPFITAMKLAGKVTPVVLATGVLPDLDKVGPIPAEAYFARSEWLDKNFKAAAGFMRALEGANNDLAANLPVYRQYLIDEFKMPKDQAEAVGFLLQKGSQSAKPSQWQLVIDAMLQEGMLKTRLRAEDLIYEIKN